MDEDGIPVGKVHPRFLDSNSNIHTWAFSAIAELIDNAYDPDVKAKEVRISKRVIEDQVCLMVKDNGKGMTRETLHNMMSFGYNDKDKCATVRHAAVGQYGNGFKSGAMRLGKDALVFTRQENTLSVGLLSQTYLKDIKADNVRVPMVTWNISDKVHCIGGETSLNVILKHSIFKAEEDLLRELAGIERTGTTIIIYNLCRRSDGVMELDFESDLSDIRDPKTYLRDVNAEATASTSNIQKRRYMESLKEYCKILYLKPRMKIYIQGKVVRTLLIRKSLRRSQEDNYKPSWANGAKIPITFGFTSPRLDDYGVMLYHKNRLILAYEKVGCQKQTNDIGKDVIAVVEANPIKVVNNKQDFVRDANYSTLMDNISKKLKDYWNVKNGKDVDPMEDNLTNNDGSVNHVQCDNCNKWRWLRNGVREEDLPEKWYCRLNDDFRYNRCDIEEEEEDENKRDEQIRAFQKMKKKTPKGPKKKPENQSSQLVNNPEEIPVALQESTDERQVQNIASEIWQSLFTRSDGSPYEYESSNLLEPTKQKPGTGQTKQLVKKRKGNVQENTSGFGTAEGASAVEMTSLGNNTPVKRPRMANESINPMNLSREKIQSKKDADTETKTSIPICNVTKEEEYRIEIQRGKEKTAYMEKQLEEAKDKISILERKLEEGSKKEQELRKEKEQANKNLEEAKRKSEETERQKTELLKRAEIREHKAAMAANQLIEANNNKQILRRKLEDSNKKEQELRKEKEQASKNLEEANRKSNEAERQKEELLKRVKTKEQKAAMAANQLRTSAERMIADWESRLRKFREDVHMFLQQDAMFNVCIESEVKPVI